MQVPRSVIARAGPLSARLTRRRARAAGPDARPERRALSPRVAARRRALAVRLWVAATIWSVALVLAALVVPSSGSDTTSDPTGLTLTQSTLAQSKGLGAVALIAIPMLACAVVGYALVHEHRERWRAAQPVAWTAIGLLTAESLLGILGVGAFMLPAAVLLALAVRVTRSTRTTPARADADHPATPPATQPTAGP